MAGAEQSKLLVASFLEQVGNDTHPMVQLLQATAVELECNAGWLPFTTTTNADGPISRF